MIVSNLKTLKKYTIFGLVITTAKRRLTSTMFCLNHKTQVSDKISLEKEIYQIKRNLITARKEKNNCINKISTLENDEIPPLTMEESDYMHLKIV